MAEPSRRSNTSRNGLVGLVAVLGTLVVLTGTAAAGGLPGQGGGVSLDENASGEDVAYVLFEDVDDYWNDLAADNGVDNPDVGFVYVDADQKAASGCGTISGSEMNAFYCPSDDTIYLTEAFTEQTLATTGPSGVAYTVAHEYGHNVAYEIGAGTMRNPGGELYADYLAGMYAADAVADGDFTVEQVQSAVELAGDLGDTAYGDSDHHGTPYQRQEAFVYGYETGSVAKGYEVYSAF